MIMLWPEEIFPDGFSIKLCVEQFGKVKVRLHKAMGREDGEKQYRAILNRFGARSSNQFRDAESATPCYCTMLEAAKQAEALGVSEGDAK